MSRVNATNRQTNQTLTVGGTPIAPPNNRTLESSPRYFSGKNSWKDLLAEMTNIPS